MSRGERSEECILEEVLQESKKDIVQLDDLQFEKYVAFIAMMTHMESTNEILDAQHKICRNYEGYVEEYLEEMYAAKAHFEEQKFYLGE